MKSVDTVRAASRRAWTLPVASRWTRLSGWLVWGGVLALQAACSTSHAPQWWPGRAASEPAAASHPAAQPPARPAVTPAPSVAPAQDAPRSPAAEAVLAQGVKAYQAGQYAQSETLLKQALKAGLDHGADVATAHKHLAFIYCTSKREAQCLAAFKAARAADRHFALSKAEAGHPMWARPYRQAMGLK